jgi:Bacterial SH3 domain
MKGDIDKIQAQENLKRISANFELELLRLIKTLNLISQSKELYREQITFIQALTDRYKLRLSDFTIRLLDLERKSHEVSHSQDADERFAAPKEPVLTPSAVIDVITELRRYFDEFSTELENNKNGYLNKLDSVYSVYNLQLGASQTDLDHKLRELQKEISSAADSNGAGGKEKDLTEDVTQIDYVKPSLRQHETVKTKSTRIDYIGPDIEPDEPIKQVSHKTTAQAAPNNKAKPETKTEAKSNSTPREPDADKDAKIKNSYVIGAGLLILGIIVGVLFYDMLMRMWGVPQATVVDVKTYPSPANKALKKAAPPPPVQKEQAKAPAVPKKVTEKVKEENNPPQQIQTPQEAVKEKPAEIVTAQLQAKTEKDKGSEPTVPTDQSPGRTAAGIETNYTVIGVGANVRSGPGMDNDIVTVVNEGDVFKGLGEKSGRWVKVQTPDGKKGWISTTVIREVE